MTPREIADRGRKFAKEVGEEADFSISVGWGYGRDKPLYASLYAEGITRGITVGVYADDFEGLFTSIEAEWAKRRKEARAKKIRAMALDIIRITADLGECTDAALRGEKYTHDDVKRYGDEAIAEANRMAGAGPFEIKFISAANAA